METAFQVDQQPAVSDQSPSTPGSVAPPQPERDQRPTPGAVPAQESRQPAAPQQPVAQDGQSQAPATPPQDDYRAQLERERQERLRYEREANQYRQTIAQVQKYAEEQQENQRLQQSVQMMLATADNMPQSEANTYLRNQVTNLLAQQKIAEQQRVQQLTQQHQQEIRAVAAEPYANHLISSLGIPPEAKQELLALRDPELMYQQAPLIKQRYDAWSQQRREWEQQQQQLARSQEVNALRQSGLGAVGGQQAGSAYTLEVDDDPDVAAMQILAHLRERDRARGG